MTVTEQAAANERTLASTRFGSSSMHQESTPVGLSQRIEPIDAVRGVAILGILLMNIQSYSMVSGAYENPTIFGDLHGANFRVWLMSHLLADLKFISIFSMLFGAGILLMTGRVEARGHPSTRLHFRRMAWLALFGLLHGYLLWSGDILFHYALCGMIVYWFRHLPPRRLLIAGFAMICVASIVALAYGAMVSPAELGDLRHEFSPSAADIAKELHAHELGWLGEVQHRAPETFEFETTQFFWGYFWREAGLMLIGMAFLKLGILSAKARPRIYWTMITLAIMVGVPIILIGVQKNFAAHWRLEYSFFYGVQYNYWGSLLVSFGWLAAVMLIFQSSRLRLLIKPIQAAGRMAFTNYIMQTAICTTIFYGFGLGLYGKISRVQQLEIVVLVWVLEVLLSSIWLKHFYFGPLEWLWRSLTYLKMQPFRRTGKFA